MVLDHQGILKGVQRGGIQHKRAVILLLRVLLELLMLSGIRDLLIAPERLRVVLDGLLDELIDSLLIAVDQF